MEEKEGLNSLVQDASTTTSGRVDMQGSVDDSPLNYLNSGKQSSFGPKHGKKKGAPWSEYEHMLFLKGLEQYGRGDWRSISRKVVVTKTPTQVASHAQKYFLRQAKRLKERKRPSIHDITTVDDNVVAMGDSHRNWMNQTVDNSTQMQMQMQPQQMQMQMQPQPQQLPMAEFNSSQLPPSCHFGYPGNFRYPM